MCCKNVVIPERIGPHLSGGARGSCPPSLRPFLFQELLLEFESEMQRQEHEFQLRADDMSNVVMTHELKVAGWAGALEGSPLAEFTAAAFITLCCGTPLLVSQFAF